MAKIQARKPAPKLSARDEIILEATDVLLRAEKYMGISAVAALSSFTKQIDNKTLTIRAARKILNDKTLLAELLVKADQNYWDDINKIFRERENKDLAIIKDNTAIKTTLITAAAFCILSPAVTATEQFIWHGLKAEFQALLGNAKKHVTQPSTDKSQKPQVVVAPQQNDKTVVLQFCKSGLCDVATGKPPQLTGKEKVAVIVSVNSQPLLSIQGPKRQDLQSRHRRHAHYGSRHYSR